MIKQVVFLFGLLTFMIPIVKGELREVGSVRTFSGLTVPKESLETNSSVLAANETTTTEGKLNSLDAIKEKVLNENRFISKLDSASFFSLPLGLGGGGEKGDDYAIIIDKATIYPQYAEFSAFMVLTNPFDGKKVRFRADKIQFSFKGGLTNGVKLVLMETLSTKLIDKVTLNWLEGSFVDWDCKGFKQIGLNGEVELDKDLFIGVDPATGTEKGAVKSSFYANFADFKNFLVDISFSAFKIKGFEEAYFTFENVVLDFSDKANSLNFKLPANYKSEYTGDKVNLWRGLYIKKALITLSPKFKKANGSPTAFYTESLVIDNYGLSGILGAENLLSLQEGQLGNWAMSVSKLAIEFRTGHFQSFVFNGTTLLPSSATPLQYTAFFDAKGALQMGISISKNIDFKAFAANVQIDKSSKIDVYIDKNKFVPTALLNGKITFGAPKSENSKDSTFVSMPQLDFQGMRFSAAPPVFDLNYLGFESKEGISFNQFPITITKASYQKQTAETGEFSFGVRINLVPAQEDALTAQTEIGLITNFQKWRFQGVELQSIDVHGEKKNAYQLDGQIMFANGDPIYGDGFKGTLKAVFGKDIKVDALALFGTVNNFRYFMADAFVCLPNPGVPCGPIILKGFGGGLYYRMRQALPGSNQGSEFGRGLSDIVYVPDKSMFIGLKAAVSGGIVKSELVDAKVSFEISFYEDGGISQVAFVGDAKILSPPVSVSDTEVKKMTQNVAQGQKVAADDNSALMRAVVKMQMDFGHSTYHSSLEMFVNIAGALKGRGANNRAGLGVMHIDPDKWYLHMGTPTDPIGLDLIGIMQVGGYFMAGYEIPNAVALPTQVLDVLNMSQNDFNNKRATNDILTGKGLAFGASFAVSTGEKKVAIFYGRFDLGGGYDVLLLDYGKNAHCKNSSGTLGINGWYAQGQAYAYFNGNIDVQVPRLMGKPRKFNILKLTTAAAAHLEGPNPFWLKGAVGGRYSILGGMVKGNCNFQVTIGNVCDIVTDKELSDTEIIGDIAPTTQSSDIDVFTLPQVVFNLPIDVVAKVSDDPKVTEQFKVKLNELVVYQGSEVFPGSLEWSADKKTVAFTPTTIFNPNTKYKVVVKVGFMTKKDDQSSWEVYKGDDGKVYNEVRESEFETGNLPDKIPASYVLYTYPVNRMMNFYKQESNQAYITFKADLNPFFQPQAGWQQKVKWTPLTGGTPIYSAFTYNQSNKSLETAVPAGLTNDKTYSFEVMNIPESNNNEVSRNVKENATEQVAEDGNSATVTTREAEGVISQADEKAIYGVKFRCSQYNKFLDKVNVSELQVRFLYNVRPAVDYPGATIYGNEMFDGYEIQATADRAPLVTCTAQLDGADWYKANIYPLMYEHYPLHSTSTVIRDVTLLGLPPVKPISLWQIDYSYVMSDDDLASGVKRSEATFTHIVNYLPGIWADDYVDIRNKVVNLVNNKKLAVTPLVTRIIGTYPWPQVSLGNYPVKIEYHLPGRGTVTSSKVINIRDNIEVKQVNLISNE